MALQAPHIGRFRRLRVKFGFENTKDNVVHGLMSKIKSQLEDLTLISGFCSVSLFPARSRHVLFLRGVSRKGQNAGAACRSSILY